jgi:hypothetical protein
MRTLQGAGGMLALLGAFAVLLFLPRRVPPVNAIVHPFLFGNDAALSFPISWSMLGVYIGVVAVLAGIVSFLLRNRG